MKKCCENNIKWLKDTTFIEAPYSMEGIKIGICTKCKTNWLERYQRLTGTGSDNILVKEGQIQRGYSLSNDDIVEEIIKIATEQGIL